MPFPYVARLLSAKIRDFIGTTPKLKLYVYSRTPIDTVFTESHWYKITGPIYWAQKAEVGFLDYSMAEVTGLGMNKPPITSHEIDLGGTGTLIKRWLGVATNDTDLLIARVVYQTTLWSVSRKTN